MAFLDDWSSRVSRWLARYGLAVLRVCLGLLFVGFGVLEFVPGLSPAEDLASETMHMLTLGLIPEGFGLLLTATPETGVGLLLLTGRFLRLGLELLGLAMVGILPPLVLIRDRLFAGPDALPRWRASMFSRT